MQRNRQPTHNGLGSLEEIGEEAASDSPEIARIDDNRLPDAASIALEGEDGGVVGFGQVGDHPGVVALQLQIQVIVQAASCKH